MVQDVQKSSVVNDSLDPEWNESFKFIVSDMASTLQATVLA